MNVLTASTAAALLLSAVTKTGVTAQGQRPDGPGLAKAVDELVTRVMATGATPALGVAIVLDGRTIYAKSHGLANTTAGIRADDRTLWYVASTSKSFTGFGAMLLEHAGVIDINAPITQLLPQARWHADARPGELTLASFLSHTHGISSNAVVTNAAFTGNIPEKQWPELLAYSPPLATRDLAYSNLGYNVAAMVIDTKRPEGWRRYLDESVFAPAGMRDTYSRVSGLDTRRIAMPHDIARDLKFVTTPFRKTDVTMNSAGGTLATLHDLARWVTVHMQDGLIDGRQVYPAEVVRASHRQIAAHPRPASFAFFGRAGWSAGWDIGSYETEPMISRFGGYESTRSHLSFLPRRRVGVVAMAISATGSTLTDIIAAYAYDLEAGRPDALERANARLQPVLQHFREAPVRIASFDSVTETRRRPLAQPMQNFLGTFEHPAYGPITWSIRDSRLWYDFGPFSGPADVYDAGRNQLRVVFGGAGTVVTFQFDAQGRASELMFSNNGPFKRRQ